MRGRRVRRFTVSTDGPHALGGPRDVVVQTSLAVSALQGLIAGRDVVGVVDLGRRPVVPRRAMAQRAAPSSRARVVGTRVGRWLRLTLQLAALWAAWRSGHAAAEPERVVLQLSPTFSAASADQLRSAIAGQLSDLARVEPATDDEQQPMLCRVVVDRSAAGLTVSFRDSSGSALAATRALAEASAELLATEVASVARAVVVALLAAKSGSSVRSSPAAAAPSASAGSSPTASRPLPPAASRESLPAASAPAAAPTDSSPTASSSSSQESAPPAESAPSRDSSPSAASSPSPDLASSTVTSTSQPVVPSSAGRLTLSALYTGNAYAPQLVWQSGVRVEAAVRLLRWLHAGVGYALHPRVVVPSGPAELRILDHGPSALVGVRRAGARFLVAGELVVGLTNTVRETLSVAGQLATTPDSRRWSTLLALRVRARFGLPRWSSVGLEVDPALELVNTGDSAVKAEARETVLSPRTLRFRLDAGFFFDLL